MKREMVLDSHNKIDRLSAEFFSTVVSADAIFVNVFPTTVETLICKYKSYFALASSPPP